jgi:excisionase family DNA binding protein
MTATEIMTEEKNYATTKELARRWGVHRSTVVRWVHAGILQADRIGPKTIRIPLQEPPARPMPVALPETPGDHF